MRVADLGESGLLAELERRRLVTGIENDAAQVARVVVTQDALVEGTHFRREWTSWRDLGYKAAAVNLSDLAASGAAPEALLVTLAVPGDTLVEDVLELYRGLAESGVRVVGGDLSSSDAVVVAVTAVGRSEWVPGRGGASPGDLLVVTGPLGGSAAGHLCLREGIEHPLVDAHRRPPIRIEEGLRLAREAHALTDLSDGLAADAAHLAERSGCRLVIDLELVPIAPGVREVAELLGADLWELVCGFGEDYELLAAVPNGDREAIGRCESGSGVELRRAGETISVSGWRHFD